MTNIEGSFHGFLGQNHIVRSLKEHCTGALSKGDPLPHILLMGESGFGKTHLATAVAAEMGTTCHTFFASPQTKRWQLASDLSRVQKGDCFYIDEIHALLDSVQECLYPALDTWRVPVVDNDTHRIIENEWITVPAFTLICSSDQSGKLKNALRQRLVLRYTLTDYSEEEMRYIVNSRASSLNVLLSPQAARRIAQAARGVPRRAKHILHSLHTCMEDPAIVVTKPMAQRHLFSIGIDDANFTPTDNAYVGVLARRGGFVSLQTIALQLGLDEMSLKRDVEAYLLKRELLSVDSRGRCLSSKGIAFAVERGLTK